MREIINFGFNGGDKFYIGTTKYWAQLAEEKNKSKIIYDKTSLKLAIDFLLGQFFAVLGSPLSVKLLASPWALIQPPSW